MDFGWIWPHALGSKHYIIKGNLRLPEATLSAIEDGAMVFGSLYQVQEVLVMLPRSAAEDAFIIMYSNNAG